MSEINQNENKVVRYVRLVTRLNNVAVQQIKNGDFDEAVSSCRCALKALQRIDSTNIDQCIEIVEKMIDRAIMAVMQTSDKRTMFSDFDSIVVCLGDSASVTNIDQSKHATPIHIDCVDINSISSDEVETISAITMYNMGVAMYRSSTGLLHHSEKRSARLVACQKVLELSSEASQPTDLCITQFDRASEISRYTISLLAKNLLYLIYDEQSDSAAAKRIQESGNELKKSIEAIRIEQSRLWGSNLIQRAASAA